ncbi:hypothetical protein TIFTF001_015938 [Ficus carica]|uniref:Uncharacterized protein n=1 Tax=Ficus carica TaxID=3494 RepID=A0AA88AMI1_FICCA|nr:hypothetical protein TIFTF001_015938 [Ficus carica]
MKGADERERARVRVGCDTTMKEIESLAKIHILDLFPSPSSQRLSNLVCTYLPVLFTEDDSVSHHHQVRRRLQLSLRPTPGPSEYCIRLSQSQHHHV